MDEDTIEYWKEKYEELNAQYDEFQKHSYELENELELQLKHSEDKIKDLQNRNNRLTIDNDTLKNKLNELNSTTHKQISQLQEELAKFKAVKDEMQKYIRELEQKNDNLEQTNRCAMFSLGEFESKLNEALERNAILQIELDEKDELAEAVQRLRDEARDLKQELAVRQHRAQKEKDFTNHSSLSQTNSESLVLTKANTSSMETDQASLLANATPTPTTTATETTSTQSPQPSSSSTSTNLPQQPQAANLNAILNELNLQQVPNQLVSPKISNTTSNGYVNYNGNANQTQQQQQQQQQQQTQPVTPSIRISALNFVGDALRKVTSMESRLVATRNLMKESNRDRRSATISSVEASRTSEPINQQTSGSSAPTNSKLIKTSQ